MSESPANKVMAIVESARISRRQEEGARFFALISMPVSANRELILTLMENIHNPIELAFGLIQPSLAIVQQAASKDEPDAEIVDMTVDGEAAKVKRPRRASSNGASANGLHAFKENEATPGLCGVCHHRVEDAAHDVSQPHAHRSKKGIDLNATTHTEEELACEICGLGLWDPSGIHGAGVGGAVVEEIDALAQSLIDAAHEDDPQPAAEAVGAAEGA